MLLDSDIVIDILRGRARIAEGLAMADIQGMYVLHRKIGSPDQFFVFEQYENEDAIKHHSATPHFLAYHQVTAHLVTGRDVSRWVAV